MVRFLKVFIPALLVLSCNSTNTKTDLKTIQNLEQRISALEKELKGLKKNTKRKETKAYFSIGSSLDEVLEIMGQPTSFMETAPEARQLDYELSSVYIYQNKVISYDNTGENLKVRVK